MSDGAQEENSRRRGAAKLAWFPPDNFARSSPMGPIV
jgi:hypothetical protein